MADRSRAIRCTAENVMTPLPLNSRLLLPNAGDAETLAVLGSQIRRQAHLRKYMLSEVRPQSLKFDVYIWTMMKAERMRLFGKMDPSEY